MIEEFMLAANEAVAGSFQERGERHPLAHPRRPRLRAGWRSSRRWPKTYGIPVDLDEHAHPQQGCVNAGAPLDKLKAAFRRPKRRCRSEPLLRSLKQATYDVVNIGHFRAAASADYLHFTSPIRRYPDLICHRALLSTLDGEEPAPEVGWVAAAGPWCSAREREAMSIERDADDIARCFLLERRLASGGIPRRRSRGRSSGSPAPALSRPSGSGESSRGCCPCAGCAGTGGSSTRRGRSSSGHARALRFVSGIRCHSEWGRSTRRGAGSICCRADAGLSPNGQVP